MVVSCLSAVPAQPQQGNLKEENMPTEAQVKEFWEKCGLHYYPDCECIRIKGICWGESEETHGINGHWHFTRPSIDLNNLFKYAVPKVLEGGRDINLGNTSSGWACIIIDGNGETCNEDKDPALALFWAIYPILKEAKNG